MAFDAGEVVQMMNALVTDTTIPKNIRKAISDAKARLEEDAELNLRVSAAIYLVESISDDINMPAYARTQVWAILSALESLKEGA